MFSHDDRSRFQFRVQRNLGVQQTRNRAARLGAVGDGGEFLLVNAGNARRQVQMRFRDGETRIRFIQRDGGRGVDGGGGETGLAEFRRKRHRETARVRSRDQFLGIRPDAIFKTRAE